jgi:hypothetical protein
MSRLVMIHGVCWGIGQSTLCRRLASVIPDADVLWEDELSQPAIFTRDEFATVAARFHRHNANPDAGIGNPTAPMLEDAYQRLVQTALAHGRTTLMGWSIMDLAEDLDWARADEHALQRHSRVVRDILTPLDPVLVCIDGDIAVALKRAVAQRGRAWFTQGRPIEDAQWHELRQRLLGDASMAARRIVRAFEAGGWCPALQVDGTAFDADEVFRAVAGYLRRHGVAIEG